MQVVATLAAPLGRALRKGQERFYLHRGLDCLNLDNVIAMLERLHAP